METGQFGTVDLCTVLVVCALSYVLTNISDSLTKYMCKQQDKKTVPWFREQGHIYPSLHTFLVCSHVDATVPDRVRTRPEVPGSISGS